MIQMTRTQKMRKHNVHFPLKFENIKMKTQTHNSFHFVPRHHGDRVEKRNLFLKSSQSQRRRRKQRDGRKGEP